MYIFSPFPVLFLSFSAFPYPFSALFCLIKSSLPLVILLYPFIFFYSFLPFCLLYSALFRFLLFQPFYSIYSRLSLIPLFISLYSLLCFLKSLYSLLLFSALFILVQALTFIRCISAFYNFSCASWSFLIPLLTSLFLCSDLIFRCVYLFIVCFLNV